MRKCFTTREQAELLIELAESPNRGNSCSWDERVNIAEQQLIQIDEAIQGIRERNKQ
jgi:hypothetical protein